MASGGDNAGHGDHDQGIPAPNTGQNETQEGDSPANDDSGMEGGVEPGEAEDTPPNPPNPPEPPDPDDAGTDRNRPGHEKRRIIIPEVLLQSLPELLKPIVDMYWPGMGEVMTTAADALRDAMDNTPGFREGLVSVMNKDVDEVWYWLRDWEVW